MDIRLRGELGDGHVHMTAEQYVEHKTKEQFYDDIKELKKLANNPILSKKTKKLLYGVVTVYHAMIFWREQYVKYRALYEAVKGGKDDRKDT